MRAGWVVSATPALAGGKTTVPDFGPNVTIFDPSVPVAEINAKLQSLATASNGADLNRNAVYFHAGHVMQRRGRERPVHGDGIFPLSVGFMKFVQGPACRPATSG